jgi:hypothetical protein
VRLLSVPTAQLAQLAQLAQPARLDPRESNMNYADQIAQQIFGETRLDSAVIANGTAFLERQLTQIRSKIETVQYEIPKAMQYIPLATDIGPYVDLYSYSVFDHTGQAKIIDPSSDDIPMVGVSQREIFGRVITIGLGYDWGFDEMRKAAMAGVPLSQQKVEAVTSGLMQAIDEILRTGALASQNQTTTGLGGFVTCADYGNTRTATASAWLNAGATAAGILADLFAADSAIPTRTKDQFTPDWLLMAPDLYSVVNTTPFSAYSDVSILEYFLSKSNVKNVDKWSRLTAAGAGGKHRCIFYPRTARVLEAVVPVKIEQFPVQFKGFKAIVPCQARCGGTKVYHPNAVEILDIAIS